MAKPVANILLDEIETSQEYKDMVAETQAVLMEQWEDIIASGVIKEMYDQFDSTFRKRVDKASKIRETINRLILSGKVGALAKLQRYVTDKVSGRMKKIGGYTGYGTGIKTYLYKLFNKGGQAELEKYLGVKVKFSLSKEFYRQKIRDRARALLKGVDETTASKIARQIILGMDKGESRKELTQRLMDMGEGIAKTRAERIIRTETVAAVEYMRYETARLNGVAYKEWQITWDERTCPVCAAMSGEKVRIEDDFSAGVMFPPVHVQCRCHVFYDYAEDDTELEKKEKQYIFYEHDANVKPYGLNRNLYWAGGEKLVGSDSRLPEFEEELQKIDKTRLVSYLNFGNKETLEKVISEVRGLPKKYLSDTNAFRKGIETEYRTDIEVKLYLLSKSDIELYLIIAKATLTVLGWQQLLARLKIKSKVR